MLKKEIRLIKNIPENWNAYVLSELGEFKNGINKDKSSFGFGVPFVNLMDVFGKSSIVNNSFSLVDASEKEQELYNLKAGDILFVRSSVKPEGVGQTCVVVESLKNTVYSGFIIRFRPDSKLINWKYATHCFDGSRFRQRLLVHSTIAANTNINQESLKQLAIQLPPLPEQKAIADLLSTWDEAIEKTEKLIQSKERLYRWFSRELINHNESWTVTKLGRICSVLKGKQLNVAHMNDDGAYYALNGGIEPSGRTDDWNTEAETITISEGGNSCGYVNYNTERFWSGGHCYSLLNLKKYVDKHYLYFYLKMNEPKLMKLRVGSGLPNIQKKDVDKFEVAFPSFAEQEQIAQSLSAARREIDLLKQLADKYKTQKRGLMQKMLTGEWRVKPEIINTFSE